jgi:hypothetical protein
MALVACNQEQASAAGKTSVGGAPSAVATDHVDARPALAALDTVSADDWLSQPSKVLLERVLKASSKAALDEAAKVDARAQTLVGAAYHFGAGGYPQDNAQAVVFYAKGAARGNPIAEVNLGAMMKDGTASAEGAPSLSAAVAYFQRAATQGHPIGALNLATLYRDGAGVALDYAEAAKWFKVAADRGNARAQYELGQIYYGGRDAQGGYHDMGVPQDQAEGDRLTKLAADQGYADALDSIALDAALSFEVGMSEIDPAPLYKKALDAYTRDAADGSAHAQFMLGEYYRYGWGASQDPTKAYAHYKAAAGAGVTDALNAVAEMAEKGEGVGNDEAAAAAIYRQLAGQGYAAAEYNLARMTASGLGGLAQDRPEAMRLYKLAAQHGSGFAQEYLRKLGVEW